MNKKIEIIDSWELIIKFGYVEREIKYDQVEKRNQGSLNVFHVV